MATFTPNFNLRKPAGSDLVNEASDLNANWDIVDTEIDARRDEIAVHETRLDALDGDGTGVGWHTTIAKAALENVNNSTTMQDDNHFTFTSVANGKYLVKLFLLFTAGGGSSGMDAKVGWNLPSGSYTGGVIAPDPAFANADPPIGQATWKALIGASSATISLGANGSATIAAYFQCVISIGGTGGTTTFQWAQNAAIAQNLTLEANSVMEVLRIA